jgi:archaellum biogenesis protein FlaJ (TadC family)
MQFLIAIAFVAILASLAAALFFIVRGGSKLPDDASQAPTDAIAKRNKGMARALAVRVAVSVVLFICVLLAWKLGYIQPHGIPAGK